MGADAADGDSLSGECEGTGHRSGDTEGFDNVQEETAVDVEGGCGKAVEVGDYSLSMERESGEGVQKGCGGGDQPEGGCGSYVGAAVVEGREARGEVPSESDSPGRKAGQGSVVTVCRGAVDGACPPVGPRRGRWALQSALRYCATAGKEEWARSPARMQEAPSRKNVDCVSAAWLHHI